MNLNKYMTPVQMEDPMNSELLNFYWLTLDKSLDETKARKQSIKEVF